MDNAGYMAEEENKTTIKTVLIKKEKNHDI